MPPQEQAQAIAGILSTRGDRPVRKPGAQIMLQLCDRSRTTRRVAVGTSSNDRVEIALQDTRQCGGTRHAAHPCRFGRHRASGLARQRQRRDLGTDRTDRLRTCTTQQRAQHHAKRIDLGCDAVAVGWHLRRGVAVGHRHLPPGPTLTARRQRRQSEIQQHRPAVIVHQHVRRLEIGMQCALGMCITKSFAQPDEQVDT